MPGPPVRHQPRLLRHLFADFAPVMELVPIVARLAQRLDLMPTRTTVPPPAGLVVNRPAGGVPMHVARRAG